MSEAKIRALPRCIIQYTVASMRRMFFILLVTATSSASTPVAAPPHVAAWRPLALHSGVNHIPGFLPGGGMATIVQAWHANGNAHGRHDWLVLGGRSEGTPFGVVPAEDGTASDIIRDSPFDGERVIGTVRFARGRVRGKLESLLVEAHLDRSPSGVLADHATATVRLFALRRHVGEVGETTESFVPLGLAHTTRHYCNVELAVRDTLGVPLPAGYAGANRTDGCFG